MTQIITPNRRGHQADVTPGGRRDPERNIELIEDAPNLDLIKSTAASLENSADHFTRRSQAAFDSWHSRWIGQSLDGRKWAPNDDGSIWPWLGASDTRARTVEKIVAERATIAMYALMNMKVQAKSTRPVASARSSQQMTTLLNWTLYTQMQEEITRELPLGVNWCEAFGSVILEVVWEQESRLDYVEVSRLNLYDMAAQQGGQSTLDDFLNKFFDPAGQDDLLALVQSMSPIITRKQARDIVSEMKATGAGDIPVPYVFKSKPRWTMLRPMQDIFFDPNLDDTQHGRVIDRIEFVSETDLTDRIETASYDADFVDKALDHKESGTSGIWANRFQSIGLNSYGGRFPADFDDKIKLHHFWQRGLIRGVPVLYRTVFHEDVDVAALHEPCDYEHGKFPYTAIRREFHERPILSSRGVPEIAYTWEYEIKAQRDGRTDMVDLALRPPLMAPYQDIERLKMQYSPGALIPERRANDVRFQVVPGNQPGSIEIENATKQDIAEFFGLFGDIDPILKQRRHQEVADLYIGQFKPPTRQTGQLLKQYMPDADVAEVVGPLARPFHVTRAEIQGEFELSATVDMRDIDPEFLKQKLGYLLQLKQIDSAGIIPADKAVQIGAEAIDYTLADDILQQDSGEITEKEMQDEQRAISRIVGSGIPEPLPKAGNFQLRLQVLETTLQQALQDSGQEFAQKLTKGVVTILQNRREYYQNQIQQYQENPQIGRSLITQPFNNQAPQLQNTNTGAG